MFSQKVAVIIKPIPGKKHLIPGELVVIVKQYIANPEIYYCKSLEETVHCDCVLWRGEIEILGPLSEAELWDGKS